ncbi:hypothetical protein QTN25_010464 [Entamoeba marina]
MLALPQLPRHEVDYFYVLLDQMTLEKLSIQSISLYCMDRAIFANHISTIISRSMLQQQYVVNQLAHLYLIHDILSNIHCSMNQDIYSYKDCFQPLLIGIFKELGKTKTNIKHLMKKKQFTEFVEEVIVIWNEQTIYSSEFIMDLSQKFHQNNV